MNKKITVKLLSMILSLALVFSCIPISFAAQAVTTTFSVATMNDIHYYTERLAGNKQEALYTYLEAGNCVYDDLDAILDAALESLKYEVKNNGVKYVALVGDLTTNGEYEGHVALAEKFRQFEEETGAIVLATPGNHDINNPRASSFVNDVKEEAKMTTKTDFYEIYKDLGFDVAYHHFTDYTSEIGGCLSYSVKTDDGYRLILADGGKFTPDVTDSGIAKQETAGLFTEELLQWVLDEAADAKKDGEIPLLFTHWNMSGMNYFHEYLMQGFVIDDGYKLQEILADAGINYSFGGHQHVSDVSITYSDAGNPMYSVITPTLTQFPFSYRVTDFKQNSEGGLDVTFNQRSCDEYSGVKTIAGNGTYPSPYRETGFAKQLGKKADAGEYLFMMLKKTLDNYITGIREEGSIVDYLEKELDFDIEETVNSYLFGGIYINGTSILSGENVMNFLYDIDAQLMEQFIYPKSETYALIKEVLNNVVNTQISDIPCTKFIDTFGFGDPDKGGTVGDVLLSVIAYMYVGNEDISDDPFMLDVVEFSGTVEFLDTLLEVVKTEIVDYLLMDKLLANVDLHFDKLFLGATSIVGDGVQALYSLVLSLLDSGLFTSKSVDDIVDAFVKITNNFNDVSLKRLVEAVLGTGFISYGTNIDELADSLIDMFLPLDAKQAAVYQAQIVIGGMVTDNTKDWGVTYTNNGAIDVVPTKEDMQLPVNITLNPTDDNSTSFTVNWFTKYSVTGTDIEVVKKGESFTGKADTGKNIKAVTTSEIYSAPGYDVGAFAILPYEKEIVKHTVTVTGLEADTEYKFRIGDFEKGFTDEGSITTAPDDSGSFTFIHVSDTDGYIPAHYENFSNVLNAAAKLYPDYSFMLHTGSLTAAPENDDEQSFAIGANENHFKNKLSAVAAGTNDNEGNFESEKYFPVTSAPEQLSDSGVYYSFDYGNAHFVVLNTNNLLSGGTLSKEQSEWLEKDLKANDKLWTIIAMHDETFTDNASATLSKQLRTLMEEYNVDLVLQGSEKAYVRTKLTLDGKAVKADTKTVNINGTDYETYTDALGTVAVIGGTAGHSFATSAPESCLFATSIAIDLPTFSAITVNGDTLTIDTYTVDGTDTQKIDSVAMEKSGSVKLGDVDFDGDITAADARLTLRYSVCLEEFTARQIKAANVDFDKQVTAADARLILRASVGLESFDK